MNSFIQKHKPDVIGVLSGFDRLIFRGTPRSLCYLEGMNYLLVARKVPLKDFGDFARRVSERVKHASLSIARRQERPIEFLRSAGIRKDEFARSIAKREGITKGLICVLKAIEPMRGFDINKNRDRKQLELVKRPRKCEHFYHYYEHPVFGFMHIRLQTWFPFEVQIWINGREWLSRTLDRKHIRYERRDNCFPWVADIERAQRLMDEQTTIHWPLALDQLRKLVNPAHEVVLDPKRYDYYWSVYQSEWASDVMFRRRRPLTDLYDRLVHQGITRFQCRDVLRFLGKKVTPSGVRVTSDLKARPEGIRLKHTAQENSVKIYDKWTLLRVETTINEPNRFKNYRRAERQKRQGHRGLTSTSSQYRRPRPGLGWRPMRKGIADLKRRTDVSQAINDRYLDALASLEDRTPLGELTRDLCRPKTWNGRRVRALHPWSPDDLELLRAVARAEFLIAGFRNADLRQLLYRQDPSHQAERRRRCAAITRKIRLLRAHGLVAKRPKSHRYMLTDKGQRAASALLGAYHASADTLSRLAA